MVVQTKIRSYDIWIYIHKQKIDVMSILNHRLKESILLLSVTIQLQTAFDLLDFITAVKCLWPENSTMDIP